jgi:long-chain acyl-CoA synthetase
MDADGWFHTGDIGEILSNGSVRIIDRKKNLFKLAQGEYIAPEKLENIYVKCSLVEQIFVHGNPDKTYIVAIVVLDEVTSQKFAEENSIPMDLLHESQEL